LRIALVDLPPLTALGIRTALASSGEPVETEVVADRADLIELARDGKIHLGIVDPSRPTLRDGLRLCQEVKALRPAPYLLAFSGLWHQRDLMYCLLAGIDSFVSWHEHPERLVSAVRTTLQGHREWILGRNDEPPPTDLDGSAALTARELEVLWMVRDRYTNKQIASQLSISPNTVKNHVAAILRKLGVHGRSDLFSGLHPHPGTGGRLRVPAAGGRAGRRGDAPA
jgi:DNA-binding NarL/FixJ family response regulator